MTSILSAEISAACNALGYFNGKKYLKDRYCFETVKELIRHLRRDTAQHQARILLGEAKVLQKDLLPLLKDHHEDKELFNVLLRLLVNLTHPVLLLYREEEPNDPHERQLYLSILSHQQEYKAAFIDDSIISVLVQRLSALLEIEWTERDEDCSLTIERILILMRNVLQVPADLNEEQRADNDASIHDQVLWACHTSGINAIILYLATTETEQPYFMHVLEILSQMLRDQNAAQLATAAAARSVEERRKDEDELVRLRQLEMEERQAKIKHLKGARHSKFGGTYYVKNVKSISNNDLIYHKPLHSLDKIDFDMNKQKIKPPKNRRPETVEQLERRSAYSIRLFLKELCVEFLNGAYNSVMYHVKDSLVRHKGQDNDESYYLWALKFFMEFNREYKFRIELISETMSLQTFHWVQTQLDRCQEMITTLKKARKNWVKRQHLALKAYQELLMTLLAMDKSGEEAVRNSARVIKSNIFYILEYRELTQSLLQSFDPTKMPLNYLRDLMETNHVFLKMLEHFCKSSHIVVQKKKIRKHKKKKNKKNQEEAPPPPVKKTKDEMWEDGLAEELSAVIQGNPSIPDNLVPYDSTQDSTFEEQKIECMKRIQKSLRDKNFEEAIGLLKAAIELWPDLGAQQGVEMSTDEQFISLKDIFLADLPGGALEDETPEVVINANRSEDEKSEAGSSDDEGHEEVPEVREQNFNFEDFIRKFAHPKVMIACGLVVRGFDKPNVTSLQVHAAVKLMHRICVDSKLPAMAFQASLFRTFQRALKVQKLGGPAASAAKELAQFGCYVMQQFGKISKTNPHVFLELLFWNNAREAHDITNGYGSYEEQKKVNPHAWTEVQEDEISRLHNEIRTKMITENDGQVDDRLLVEEIYENLIDNSERSLMSVWKKLRDMGLVVGSKSRPSKRAARNRWAEEELEQLKTLYEELKETRDPVQSIMEQMGTDRSKNMVKKKIIELGLAPNMDALKVKRGGGKGKAKTKQRHNSSSSSSARSSSEDEERIPEYEVRTATTHSFSKAKTIQAVQIVILDGMSSSVRWLMTSLNDTVEDRTNDEVEPVPLVPLLEDDCNALEDPAFINLLVACGLSEPIEGQEQYWRIPIELTLSNLMTLTELLAQALDNRLQSLNTDEVNTESTSTPRRHARNNILHSDSDSDTETALQRQSKTSRKKRSHSSDSDDNVPKASSSKKKVHRPVDTSDDEMVIDEAHKEVSPKKINADSSDEDIGINANQSRARIADSSDEDNEELNLTNGNSTKKSKARIADSSDDEDNSALISTNEKTAIINISQSRGRIADSSDEDTSNKKSTSQSRPTITVSSDDEDNINSNQSKPRIAEWSDEDVNAASKRAALAESNQSKARVDDSSDEDEPLVTHNENEDGEIQQTKARRLIIDDDDD